MMSSVAEGLVPAQRRFAQLLAGATGLNPRVIGSWLKAEQSGSAASGYEAKGYNNWLNIARTDSGDASGAHSGVWSNPESAARATAEWLKGTGRIAREYGKPAPGIKSILGTAGKSPDAQINAIATSGWASSGYNGGSTLRALYGELGGSGLKPVSGVAAASGPPQIQTSSSESIDPQALQQALDEVKKLSGPAVLAAGAQPARPAFAAGSTASGQAPAPIAPKALAQPQVAQLLEAALTNTVSSKLAPNEPLPAASAKAQTKLAGILAEANHIEAAKVPYQWGGGHSGKVLPGTKVTPLDCSGAVSAALGINPKVSGEFETWGAPGKGRNVTIWANAEHVLMEVNGHFWGTSHSNPGGGAGWIKPGAISPSYLKNFTPRHPAKL